MHDEKANMANKYEHSIPEGYEARIEGNKVVIERKPTEEDKMQEELRKAICRSINDPNLPYQEREYISKSVLPYFEHLVELKKEKPEEWSEDERIRKALLWCLETIEGELGIKTFDGGVSIGELKTYIEKQKEQKPVKLNDDTEVGLDRALQIVKKAKGNLCGYQSDDGIYECDHAIQTLERILKNGIVQQPAEWSEEDREMRMKILKYLSTRCNVNEYEEVEDWLNKIRPNWRPTKEQMEMLSYAMERNDKVGSVLLSLYNDLKKL